MSNVFKLDDIRNKAEQNYKAVTVEIDAECTVELLNVLRLSEDKRAQLKREDENEPQLESFRRMIRAIADTPEGAERLIEVVGENLAFYVELFNAYNEGTQAGEA
jgi:hypothetical protein